MLWNGVPERKTEKHSRYYRTILAKHPVTAMDKSAALLIPFVKETLENLGIDPMYAAVHCDMQKRTPQIKAQTYMSDIMAELCSELPICEISDADDRISGPWLL